MSVSGSILAISASVGGKILDVYANSFCVLYDVTPASTSFVFKGYYLPLLIWVFLLESLKRRFDMFKLLLGGLRRR